MPRRRPYNDQNREISRVVSKYIKTPQMQMFPFVSLSLSLSLALCLFIPRFSLRTYREHGNPMAAQNLADNGDFHAPSPIAADGDARSALIFLGTGCSSAIPNAMCLIQPSHPPCSVCSQALSIPPEQNPNYR